ncbi:flagellar biosynthetic protein FliO [Fredinandcohnia sp. QZ13]|uniref:flagellar biosynthetic protein FliO n=1 Tax=Fredinandcohnia sp. QZ13 TaxID=3073144 RepID=UPI0028534CDC|nr:flagellar biosynthetic protein FliO [Fredinandcohnia sp. QZ13]MDR4886487.1 flagellar biosynthetic protein FliO [Fredinandcohnia sp. QZ13]
MKHIKIIALALIFFHVLLVTFPVQAEEGHIDKSVNDVIGNQTEQNNDQAEQKETNPIENAQPANELTIGDFLKMIFTTLFVLALIYFLLKFVNKRNRMFNQHKFIENLGGTSLGTNRSIQIVKVGERILVVGVGDSIQLLKEIEDTDEINEILEQHNSSLESMIQPQDFINRFLEKRKAAKDKDQALFSSILQKQLTELKQGRKKIVEQLENKESSKE